MKIGEFVRLGVLRKVINGIFEEKKFFSEVILVLRLFLENKQLFYLLTNFHTFLLLFSCCPAELESVGMFKISLSIFVLCQK